MSWSFGWGNQHEVVSSCFGVVWVLVLGLGGGHDVMPSWGNISWQFSAGGGCRRMSFLAWVVAKVVGDEFSLLG